MDIGSIWKGWKIVSLLGDGSFGKVYRIEREEFGHVYSSALKVIRIPQSPSEYDNMLNQGMDERSVTHYYRSMVEGLVNEFTLMSTLRGHSNIVSYEDHEVMELSGEFGWEICIRMELLKPLFTYLKEHDFTYRDVIQLG
ncbi:MAG: serine/threonine protein kinase, partial [Mogibacterium sp.]|nr:serine/threonine protein kinase [Mogibacterium sp.]